MPGSTVAENLKMIEALASMVRQMVATQSVILARLEVHEAILKELAASGDKGTVSELLSRPVSERHDCADLTTMEETK